MLSHEFGLASHVEMWGIRGRVDAVLVVPALAGKTTTGRGWGTYGLFYLAYGFALLAEGDQGAGSLGECDAIGCDGGSISSRQGAPESGVEL